MKGMDTEMEGRVAARVVASVLVLELAAVAAEELELAAVEAAEAPPMVGGVVVVGDVSSETVTPKDSERSRGLTFQCVWPVRLAL